ncbi:MAG: ThuA domain-containing protein [Candidatus Latescibacteria bacterium]|nr:ThuA domain-containing protein [Candidatus Latescibacterota bacterium]
MNPRFKTTRRTVIKTGLVTFAAGINPMIAVCSQKAPGETKVIYFGGDYIHNGVTQEKYLRETFSKSGWRLFFAQASRFITPEQLSDTDLLIMNRTGTYDAQGFSSEGLVENRPEPDPFMAPEMEDAIIENVEKRGMGFVALHCTAGNPEHTKLMTMLGVKPVRSGAKLQPVRFHYFHKTHPITQRFNDFEIDLDENLIKEIDDPGATVLFRATGINDGIECDAGWCIKRRQGRVVVLLAGHTSDAWRHPKYRELHWRAAYWALQRDIPPFEMGK